MRGGIVLLVMSAASLARAQAPRDDLAPPDAPPRTEAAAPASSAGPPEGDAEWVLDDGVGFGDAPWDPLPIGSPLVPRGRIHFGVTLRVAALPGGSSPAPDGPQVELGVLLDFQLRERSIFHMRAQLSISGRPYAERNYGGGVTDTTGPLAVRLRLIPLSVHVAEWLALRLGVAVSVDWVPGPLGDIAAFGGGLDAEIVARFEDGQIEVGLVGGLQLDAIGRTTRSGIEQTVEPEPMIGVVANWIVP